MLTLDLDHWHFLGKPSLLQGRDDAGARSLLRQRDQLSGAALRETWRALLRVAAAGRDGFEKESRGKGES